MKIWCEKCIVVLCQIFINIRLIVVLTNLLMLHNYLELENNEG